jgi:hypothetical protein
MAGLSDLTEKAKSMFSKRGGTDAAKADAEELKDIHASEGSMGDKAKEAGEALKDPGAKGPRADEPGAEKPGADEPGANEPGRQ